MVKITMALIYLLLPHSCDGGTLQLSKTIFCHESLPGNKEDNKNDPIISKIENKPQQNFFSQNKSVQSHKKYPAYFTYEKAYKVIDIFALCYAVFHTHKRYQSVYYESNSSSASWLNGMLSTVLNALSPQILIDLSKNRSFLIGSMSVFIEALVLKTSLKINKAK